MSLAYPSTARCRAGSAGSAPSTRNHTAWCGTRSPCTSTNTGPSTCRRSIDRAAQACATGWSIAERIDAADGRVSGSGTSTGKGSWCSTPSSGRWNEAIIEKIGTPRWYACTRRVANERPSWIRSTAKVIGSSVSPGRRK